MKKVTTITLSLLFCTILVCISGQSIGQIREGQNLPNINGHTFIPVSFVEGPFTNSQFNSYLGFAQSLSFKYPLLVLDGNTIIGERGRLLFANLGFQYQQRIKDWIAFSGSLVIRTRIGTNIQSLVSQGVNTVSGFKLSWIIRLVEKEKYQLSGDVLVANTSGSFMNISGFIQDVIDINPNPSLSQSIPATNTGVGLRYAYGFNDLLGLVLQTSVRYGETFARVNADFTYRLGGLVDFNLNERTKVPLGMSLFYVNSSIPENVFIEDKSSNQVGLKLAYTGTDDFSLGAEFTYVGLPISFVDEKINVIGFLITTRYYFN